MDTDTYFRFLIALGLVLALIVVLAWLARRYGFGGASRPKGTRGRRIGVVEVAPLDSKRRLVLIRRDDVEHLVLLGASCDTVVEAGIAGGLGKGFAAALADSTGSSNDGPADQSEEGAA